MASATAAPTLSCANVNWQSPNYCSCAGNSCVLWNLPWQYLVISGVVLFLAGIARLVLVPVFGLIGLICDRYQHPTWGHIIHRGLFGWSVALFRTGMCWLAYSLLQLPPAWTSALNYVVPLPFIFCTFFWVDDLFEVMTDITKEEFSRERKKASDKPNTIKQVNTRATAWSENLRVLKYFSFIVLFLLGLAIEGVDIISFLQSATLLGLILSFALQPWLRNIVGGMHVFADEKYVLGHRIRVGGIEGSVDSITLRTTTLKRDDDSVAYIPNSRMMDQVVTNCSSRRHRLLEVRIGLDRNTPTGNIRSLMRKIDMALQTLSPNLLSYVSNTVTQGRDGPGLLGNKTFDIQLDGSLDLLVRTFVHGDADDALMSKMQSEVCLCVLQNMRECNVPPASATMPTAPDASEMERQVQNEDDKDHAMSTFAFFSTQR